MFYLCEITEEGNLVVKDTENQDLDECSLEDAREFKRLGIRVAFMPDLDGLNDGDLNDMNLITFDINGVAFSLRDNVLYCDNGIIEFEITGNVMEEDECNVELLDSLVVNDTKLLMTLLFDFEEEEEYTYFLKTKCYIIDLVAKSVRCLAFMPKFIEPSTDNPLDECARLHKNGSIYQFGDLALNLV